MTTPLLGPENYTPLTISGPVTMTASETVRHGDPLSVSGNGTVHRPTVTGEPFVGVAGHDAAPFDDVTVYVNGQVHYGFCTTAVTAGQPLLPAWTAGDQVIVYTNPANDLALALAVCGIALTSSPAAPNRVRIRWLATH